MTKILIIGGGVSGLVANHVLSEAGADCTILEPGKPGGEFTAGGLKYIHKTDGMEQLFEALDVPYSVFTVRGGIYLRGNMYMFPEGLEAFSKRERYRIQADHYTKTRRTEPGRDASKAMNDPAALGSRRALRCDFQQMIDELSDPAMANIVEAGAARLDHRRNVVIDSKQQAHMFDYCVVTVPLWILRRIATFSVAEGAAMRLNIAEVTVPRDPYAGFDYVYTPYTPADVVHRFSPAGARYSVEANGELDHEGLLSDLNFIFPDGHSVERITEGLKGHLLPLPDSFKWPDNIAPIGRFAKWDSRATTDVTLEDSKALVERWLTD